MSDKAMETGASSEDTQATPKPEFSTEGTNSSPGTDVNLTELAAKLAEAPEFRKVIENIARSDKDKGIASAKRDASEAKELATKNSAVVERFETYLARYGDKDRALLEMDRDDRIEQVLSGSAQGSVASPGSDNRPWGVRQKEILDSVGLKPSDPRVVELAKNSGKKWESQDEYLKALAEATFDWTTTDLSNPKPDASSTGLPVKSAQQSHSDVDGETELLGAELIKLSADYTKNEKRIKQINAELARRDQGA